MTLFDAMGETAPSGEPRRLSLVRLSALIAQAAAQVGRFAVEGEVHRPQSGRTGWLRFTLRDRTSQITVAVPASRRARCRVVAGERVSVTGKLDWTNDWGQLQVLAEEVLPVGEGAIAAMIAEARRRLQADGLLTRPRRLIPSLPRRIGVVCGHEAAVRADIESVVAARFPGYPMAFLETTVSGPGAADRIVEAIVELDGREDVDVIILARGGGDATALLPFSEEAVCRAVGAALTPVVSAIGHDGDRPLVDEVADLRCGTPSLAASATVPDEDAINARLQGHLDATSTVMAARLDASDRRLAAIDRHRAVLAGLDRAGSRLERAADRRRLVHPARELERAGRRLAVVDRHAPAAARLRSAEAALAAAQAQADALGPARVLARGYAVVRRSDGIVVRHPDQVAAGDALELTVAGGRIDTRVEDKE